MPLKYSLKSRLFSLITLMGLISVVSGVMIFWYTNHFKTIFDHVMETDLASYETAEKMQLSIANQKGFLTYYYLDNNPDWLKELGKHRDQFDIYLKKAFSLVVDPNDKELLMDIETTYQNYIAYKDQVIVFYKNSDNVHLSELHMEHRHLFFDLLGLGEQYKLRQWERINTAKQSSEKYGTKMRILAAMTSLFIVVISLCLSVVLVKQILEPIDRFALNTAGQVEPSTESQETWLNSIFNQARSELERSRENLAQAEKMAMVGKLAAGMAHTIRTPFTSVKMRLFSLNRSLELNDDQHDDFDVISEEILRIDNILQNFLEFSRAPKLKMGEVSISRVVETTLLLLQHRLQAYDIDVRHFPQKDMPCIYGDSEQLKEAFVNIIINGCEAINNKGIMEIKEELLVSTEGVEYISLRIWDNGSGIPALIQEKMLQPFYTSKEDGTGLGLSIANRIIEQHNGLLEFTSDPGEGTTFIINLPVGIK